ncbi:helix-turn-helix domain-containing protein [Enterococcus avium]|uniref:helix-turn-helix domain-containing protein n=1 Tax=Enterococcus avium TaxID=33945 RepID=UPI00159E489C|nr:AraC family transcriptional regulator [Enterococcus avium]NVN78117.1 helix-turn-helix domain-containing protein [Enterococcus avium]
MYLEFICPPMPHSIVAGRSIFRTGDIHERRIMTDIFDLILVERGTLYMEEDDSQYALNAGDYLLLVPNKKHRGFRPCDEETRFAWIHFSTTGPYHFEYSSKQQKRKRMNRKKYYKKDEFSFFINSHSHLNAQQASSILAIVDRLEEVKIDNLAHEKLFFSPKIDEFEAQRQFLSILDTIRTQDYLSSDYDIASQIYSYIESHSNQPFSLEILANKFSYHKSYIIQLIKKHFGTTPAQLHNQFRLEKGRNLLLKTTMSIQEIAEDLSFYDAAYFSKLFKKEYLSSPKNYRKEFQKIDKK